MEINKKYLGVLISLIVFISATGVSYLALDYLYGGNNQTTLQGKPVSSEPERGGTGKGGVDTLPLSLGIGLSLAVATIAAWVGSRSVEKDPTRILLNQGLEDMTVRDVEIFRHMIVMNEFTVPELVKKTEVSRTSVWRLVKRMSKSELVEKTNKDKLPKSGRGKPSQVYRYVGP